MKLLRFITVCVLTCCALFAGAQTMKVYTGPVITAVPSASAGDLLFEGTQAFTVMGNRFRLVDVDQIIVDRSRFVAQCVQIDYLGDKAQVTVSADIAPQLDIQVSQGHIRILAHSTLQTEVNYLLRGTSANGSFYMDGPYKATLTLDNLNLTNPDSAAIHIACGKRIAVLLPDGTASQLADAAGRLHKACFYINGHAEFSGGGTLTLCGNSRHAFYADEYTQFKPDFGTFKVTSALGDGMHIKQYLRIEGGQFDISHTAGDCIDVEAKLRRDLPDNGQAIISGGTLQLQVTADDVKGIKCDSVMTLSGGHLTALVSGNGSKGLSAGTDLMLNNYSGQDPKIRMDVTGSTYMPGDPVNEAKCRGIKVKRNFIFDGGDIFMQVTGHKAKGISVDGQTQHLSGTTNVLW